METILTILGILIALFLLLLALGLSGCAQPD